MAQRNFPRHRRPRRRSAIPHIEGLEARSLLSTAQVPAPAAVPHYVPGEVLIQFKPGVADAARAEARGRVEAALAETIDTGPMQADGRGVLERVSLPAGRTVEASIRALQANPNVAFAEPDWIYTTQDTSNDPYYTNGSLWGMYGDDATITPAVPTDAFGSHAERAWNAGVTGSKSVYVGIIDEGVQFTHPDLSDNVWTNPYDPVDGIDNDGNGYTDDVHGWDFSGNNNTIYDGTQDDHGTHVAGTIAAKGGNGVGVAGVNWDVTYIDAKFLGQFGGTTANAIKAVDYFTDLKARHGMNIVALNNSWGGGGFSQSLLDAITRAAAQNILFVAAAGNGGSDQVGDNNDTTPSYPSNYDTTAGAGYDSVIAVAAIDSNGNLAGFSNYGKATVDLAAPGVGIYSTLPTNSYGSYSGTSMATPHVTGAAALYASTHPGAPAAQIKQALLDSAIPTGSLAGKTATGGRLDAYGALSYPQAPTSPPDAPSGLGGTVLSSSQILLSWTDNSADEQGFEVEQNIGGIFQRIATTTANVTSFEVTGLTPQTSYDFRVRAVNSAGASGYTDVASVTTAASVPMGYTDHFTADPTAPGSIWAFSGTQWDYDPTNQVLKQTSEADTSVERRAMMVGVTGVPTEVLARVRVDSWQPGEYARAGVSLATDPRTTQGYSLVFTGRKATNLGIDHYDDGSETYLEFVNDNVAWSGWWSASQGGASVAFPIQVGGSNWYWFDMKLYNGTLYGKVWPETDASGNPVPKPTSWTIRFDAAGHGWNRSGGVAALNGSSAGDFQGQGRSFATASFDDVTAQLGGAEPKNGRGGKTKALALGAAGTGEFAIAPPPAMSISSPTGSGDDADPADPVQAHRRTRRPWQVIRLS